MSNTAVALFAYKRPIHLLRVLRALTPQLLGRDIPVHIFLDGAKGASDSPLVDDCFRISLIYNNKFGYSIHRNPVNLGLYVSLTEGITLMFEYYQRVIVLEDDILTSPYFLDYMLEGLETYASDSRVASIHGYSLPFKSKVPSIFFLRGADCWGWATWKDRWSLFRSDAVNMVREISERNLSHEFDLGGRVPNLQLLKDRASKKSNSWAICWHASCFLANKLTLHPGSSLVKNIGLDSSGEHCVSSAQHEVNFTHHPPRMNPVEVIESAYMSDLYGKLQAYPLFHNRLYDLCKIKAIRFKEKIRHLIHKRPKRKLLISGEYATYEEALAASAPYDGHVIVSQVAAAAASVLSGDFAYERDGMAFKTRPSNLNLYSRLQSLLTADSIIADFGGGVGGLYYNMPEAFHLSSKKIVIEQSSMVAEGERLQKHCDIKIEFFDSQNLILLPNVDILVFSAVLQYIDNALTMLKQVVRICNPRHIIIDRTPVSTLDNAWHLQINDGFYSQYVTYPVRFFSLDDIRATLDDYTLKSTWISEFDPDLPEHIGIEFARDEALT